jgi:hypothetical protein
MRLRAIIASLSHNMMLSCRPYRYYCNSYTFFSSNSLNLRIRNNGCFQDRTYAIPCISARLATVTVEQLYFIPVIRSLAGGGGSGRRRRDILATRDQRGPLAIVGLLLNVDYSLYGIDEYNVESL